MSAYQAKMNENIQQPFHELLAKFPEVESRWVEYGKSVARNREVRVRIKALEDTSWGNAKQLGTRFYVVVEAIGYGDVAFPFAFSLDYYPVCCAVKQLNNFTYNVHMRDAPQEFFNQLVDLCIQIYAESTGVDIRRVVMNFVGGRSKHDMKTDIPVEDRREIQYEKFYQWAKSKPHMNEMVFRNHNTDNMIHMAQILIKE